MISFFMFNVCFDQDKLWWKTLFYAHAHCKYEFVCWNWILYDCIPMTRSRFLHTNKARYFLYVWVDKKRIIIKSLSASMAVYYNQLKSTITHYINIKPQLTTQPKAFYLFIFYLRHLLYIFHRFPFFQFDYLSLLHVHKLLNNFTSFFKRV